jgi:hypothetical protein
MRVHGPLAALSGGLRRAPNRPTAVALGCRGRTPAGRFASRPLSRSILVMIGENGFRLDPRFQPSARPPTVTAQASDRLRCG